MKHEWKKHEKHLYLPKQEPELITVPKYKFFTITGEGNPNGPAFEEKVGVLYSLAYAVKMMPKGKDGYTPDGYVEYTVYPLEGVWDLSEAGRLSATLNKDELVYTIMIRQPDFVTEEVAGMALDKVMKKKPHPLLKEVKFQEQEEGLCVQMLHVGSYDDEPASFEVMKEYIRDRNLERISLLHREIYLSDARKAEPAKLKTVLRVQVAR